jgi:signal transduction histidine kinase/PAS domain-containing protein
LFAAFILACGLTHLFDAITFWYPVYRFNALIRLITGIISWVTVFYLIKLLPVAFSLKTASELEVEVEQRKKAEDDLKVKVKLLNEAQEIAKMGHWEWNPQNNTFTISDNMFRIYELKPQFETVPYDQLINTIHEEDRTSVHDALQQALSDKKFNELYFRIPSPDGNSKTIQMKAEVITDDNFNIHKLVGTSQDVTEQKKIEKELLIKSDLLASKNDELQKFAYIASHDLQEPLRKIRTFISRIQSPENVGDKQRTNEYIDKIEMSASRMQRLIDDILSFSRLTSDSSGFEKVNLNTVLTSVLSDMEVKIETSGAQINLDNLPSIYASSSQIGQLFQNLISNAIKFRKPNVTPVIEIVASIINGSEASIPKWIHARYKFASWKDNKFWQSEKFCKIIVRDNGIGFDPEYSERIFEAFQRLSRDHEGSGIGLAICKRIVENHHGSITVVSTEGIGTTFTIILPLSQANFL